MIKKFIIIGFFSLSLLTAMAASFTAGPSYTSTTLSNPTTYGATSSIFNYYGFPTTNYSGSVISSIGISSATELSKFPPVQVSFDITGTSCELILNPYNYVGAADSMAYYTLSDGTTTTSYTNSAYVGWSGATPRYIPITFSSSTTHHMTLSLKGNFMGVNVASGNTLSSYALPKPNLLIVEGDSYTEGYNPNVLVNGFSSVWFDGWVWQLARLQPNTLAVPNAVSGTGFTTGTPFGSRVVPDICTLYSNAVSSGKYNQIFITVSGSINDLGVSTNTLYTAATSVYTTLRNNCPQAHLFFVGNWLGAGGRLSPLAADIDNDNALSAAAIAVGVPYFSAIKANVRNAGNYSTFFPAATTDSVHPSAAGYAIMAQWVNTNLAYTFGTNWDSSSQQGGGILYYNLAVNNGSGSGYYTNGQVVTISAASVYGSYFTNWTGAVANQNLATTTITMPAANTSVTANLVVIPTTSNINVTDYGAVGDAVRFTVQTTSNSPMVSVIGTNRFSSADIGKVIEVFRAGPWLRFNNNPTGAVVVTNQDTICVITNVTNGTNLWGSIRQGWTRQADCVVGSNNRQAFQAALDFAAYNVSATNQNVTVNIPDGNYLIIGPKALNPNYVMGLFDNDIALSISTGGITLNGQSTNAVLLGCGAGMNHVFNDNTVYGGYGHFNPLRGTLLQCLGPIANSQYPLVFQNLTFDGGVKNGLQSYNYFTINEANGDGWDTSHDVLLDINPNWTVTQMHQLKVFTNCVFQHWRGEMLKNVTSNAGGTNTFIDIANCVFYDGNSTAINVYFGQHIHGCTFSTLYQVEEYYQANATLPSVFENNLVTNISGNSFSVVGSTVTANPPSYTLKNNVFYGSGNWNIIRFAPAENIFIISNAFYGIANGVTFSGVGVQPTDGTASVISNVVITANAFNLDWNNTAITMDGYPVTSVLVSSNTGNSKIFMSAAAGWKTNIVLTGNVAAGWIQSGGVQNGTYLIDALDNQFAPFMWDTGTYYNTNAISYGNGRYHAIQDARKTFFIDDTIPQLVPAGATLSVSNADSVTATVFSSGKMFNLALSGPKALLSPGQSLSYYWTNGFWKRISQPATPVPPKNLTPVQ